MAKLDLVGKRYGRLVVVKECGKRKRNTEWLCQCDCGNLHKATTNMLNRGHVKSCGCLHSEAAVANGKKAIKHGESHSSLYRVWGGMKTRCNNPKCDCYEDYGGRGISICKEWNDSFNEFRKWALSSGYEEGLSIDRVDVNGNYEPNNCRWATMIEQQNNRRSNQFLTMDGETHTIAEWARILGKNPNTVHKRISAYGYDPKMALLTPIRSYKGKSKCTTK